MQSIWPRFKWTFVENIPENINITCLRLAYDDPGGVVKITTNIFSFEYMAIFSDPYNFIIVDFTSCIIIATIDPGP